MVSLEDKIMLISSNAPANYATRPNNARPAAAQEEPIAALPQESFTLSSASQSHYSGGSVAGRVVGGALTGLGAHYITGGDVWGTAKLGAAINGTVGAVVGGLGGAVVGAAAGSAAAGAATGAVVFGGVGAVTGGAKGALIAVVGNALGGGPVAFAASGAVLGAIGL
jgi:hypothetical protein